VVKKSILNLLKKIEPLRNFSTLRKPLRKDVFVEYCKVICFEVGVFIGILKFTTHRFIKICMMI